MIRVSIHKFVTACLTLMVLFLFFMYYPSLDNIDSGDLNGIIQVFSVLGWIELVYCVYSWKKLTGKLFSLYTIFALFYFLFTYGQCLMWAFGIHIKYEIGAMRMYTLPVPSRLAIIKAQVITLVGYLVFHFGALMVLQRKNKTTAFAKRINESFSTGTLYDVCKVTSLISTPLMFYSIARNISINSVYGYGAALYNADVVATQNNIILLVRQMYFPSLVGMLVGSNYKKEVMGLCYINFAVFTVLSMFAGDRGEWLFPLFFLIWLHGEFRNKIKFKEIIRYLIFGFLLIILSVGVRRSRKTGVTLAGLIKAVLGEENPLIAAVFELGNSMSPTVILLEHGWKTYPFGNTYILALCGMVTEKVIKNLIPDYLSLSSWFSRIFLKIRYGAGFSIIAEAIMNYGPYMGLIAMFILGIIFSKSVFCLDNIDCKNNPVRVFIAIATANSLILTIRNTMLVALKMWVFSTFSIICLMVIVESLSKSRKRSRNYV